MQLSEEKKDLSGEVDADLKHKMGLDPLQLFAFHMLTNLHSC